MVINQDTLIIDLRTPQNLIIIIIVIRLNPLSKLLNRRLDHEKNLINQKSNKNKSKKVPFVQCLSKSLFRVLVYRKMMVVKHIYCHSKVQTQLCKPSSPTTEHAYCFSGNAHERINILETYIEIFMKDEKRKCKVCENKNKNKNKNSLGAGNPHSIMNSSTPKHHTPNRTRY